MLPKLQPNRGQKKLEQKKHEQNRSSQLFLQYYNAILEIFSKIIKISEAVAVKLTEVQLIDAAERDQMNAITCESIKIRALMGAVNTMIKKAVRPRVQLRIFMGVLVPYDCFSHIIDELRKAGLFYQNNYKSNLMFI